MTRYREGTRRRKGRGWLQQVINNPERFMPLRKRSCLQFSMQLAERGKTPAQTVYIGGVNCLAWRKQNATRFGKYSIEKSGTMAGARTTCVRIQGVANFTRRQGFFC